MHSYWNLTTMMVTMTVTMTMTKMMMKSMMMVLLMMLTMAVKICMVICSYADDDNGYTFDAAQTSGTYEFISQSPKINTKLTAIYSSYFTVDPHNCYK